MATVAQSEMSSNVKQGKCCYAHVLTQEYHEMKFLTEILEMCEAV